MAEVCSDAGGRLVIQHMISLLAFEVQDLSGRSVVFEMLCSTCNYCCLWVVSEIFGLLNVEVNTLQKQNVR